MIEDQRTAQGRRRREQFLKYLRDYFARHNYGPTIHEIKADLDIASTSIVHYHLKGLEAAGQILRDPDQARTIRLVDPWGLPPHGNPRIPVFGPLRPDQPLHQVQPNGRPPNAGTIAVPPELYYRHPFLYGLRVSTDWPQALLAAGDLVVCAPAGAETPPADDSVILTYSRLHRRCAFGRLTKRTSHWQVKPPHPEYETDLIPLPGPHSVLQPLRIIRGGR